MADIVVIGSMNMDIVTRVERFPAPGETLQAYQTELRAGGKGANQAVAAARAGVSTAFVGAVGVDAFGHTLVDELTRSGVDTKGVRLLSEVNTGTAVITVDDLGRNTILVTAGANQHVTWQQANAVSEIWEGCQAVLLQHEIPFGTNREIVEECAKRGIRVFYNPAPAFPIDGALLPLLDVCIVNEHEAEALTGVAARDEVTAGEAAARLMDRGVKSVIVTLGEQGSLYQDVRGKKLYVPACSVLAVDTTAAGDTFLGAYAARVVRGEDIAQALSFASAAAALAVTRPGAQDSIPELTEVEKFLKG